MSSTSSLNDRAALVLGCLLKALRPAVRLLLRSGVTYPVFAAALKRSFLEAAQDELQATGMARTDSALTLLSGVHRRDVRTLLRQAPAAAPAGTSQLSLATQVVARWLHDADFHDRHGRPRALDRGTEAGSFDDLVTRVSRDVRPRAVLDELKRLGVAAEGEAGVELLADGFAPRQGLAEMGELFSDNLHDHLAAASANLAGQGNYLEQSVFVDQITASSADKLHKAATQAWKIAFRQVMTQAQARFDADARLPDPRQRRHRARFGVYFYSEQEDPPS